MRPRKGHFDCFILWLLLATCTLTIKFLLDHKASLQGFHHDFEQQGQIQKIQKEGAEETDDIQKEGAEETDDAVLHHSGNICDQTLGLTLRTFQKYRKKGGALAPP